GEAMLELAHRAGRPELESLALTQLAAVAGVQGDVDQSLELVERAEALAESSGSREAMAWALAVHARRFDASEADEAERYLREALAICDEIGAAGRGGWTLSNLAWVYRGRGDLRQAEECFREADRLVAEAQRRVGREDVWTRASLLHARGLVRAAQGRTDEARAAFGDALEVVGPTMYSILAREIRGSLEALEARAAQPT